MVRGGSSPARNMKRAMALLKADDGEADQLIKDWSLHSTSVDMALADWSAEDGVVSSPSARGGAQAAREGGKPWKITQFCIPSVNRKYMDRMVNTTGIYMYDPDPDRPVVCFDETSRQLLAESG